MSEAENRAGLIILPEVRSFGFDDDAPSSSRSPSGVKVDTENATQCMAVLACIRVLSESLAALPVHIYRRLPEGGKVVEASHPSYRVIHDSPNDWQTSFEWRETLMTHLGLYGNAYCEIVRDSRADVVIGLTPLHPSRMKVERIADGSLRYTYTEPSASGSVGAKKETDVTTYTQEEIMHFRWMSNDSVTGMVPIDLAREAIALARACEIHGARFFGGGARPGVVLQTDQSVTEETARLIKEFWEKAHRGPWNAHKTAILTGGLKAEELGGSNADSQFLESRRYQCEEICRFYRVPPHMIMDLSRSTFSNIEHQGMDFVTHTLMPWLRRFESVMSRVLLSDPALFIEFDVRGLLRGDAAGRSAYYQSMFNMGVLCINEIRALENMNPVPGGDIRYIPMNMAPLGPDGPVLPSQQPAAPPAGSDPSLPAPAQQPALPASPPKVRSAHHGIAEGDWVTWGDGKVGKVDHVMYEGELNLGDLEIEASPEEPVMLVSVWADGEFVGQEPVLLNAAAKAKAPAGRSRRKKRG
jgi:HK97 family phage portal protein